jgi:hypothetical protein
MYHYGDWEVVSLFNIIKFVMIDQIHNVLLYALVFFSYALIFFLWRMAPTKSSHPRKIEKKSDAQVPNVPTGSDHEDDTTKQGSGDVKASNLPTSPSGHFVNTTSEAWPWSKQVS